MSHEPVLTREMKRKREEAAKFTRNVDEQSFQQIHSRCIALIASRISLTKLIPTVELARELEVFSPPLHSVHLRIPSHEWCIV